MEDIKKIIRDVIRERGTIRKIATDLGMDHANLLKILRKDANPGLKTVEKLADYLGHEVKLVRRKEVNPKKSKPSRSKRQKDDL